VHLINLILVSGFQIVQHLPPLGFDGAGLGLGFMGMAGVL
jgi:hypothetical protein